MVIRGIEGDRTYHNIKTLCLPDYDTVRKAERTF